MSTNQKKNMFLLAMIAATILHLQFVTVCCLMDS